MTGKASAKWGAYSSEADDLAWARELVPEGYEGRSLEAALMDWADDIAYAVHDLEDFFRAGRIPLDRLVSDVAERERFLAVELVRQGTDLDEQERNARRDAFVGVMNAGPSSKPYEGTRFDRATLRSFTSSLIHRYIKAVSFSGGGFGEEALAIDEDARREVAMLKGLTWHYVINSPSLVAHRFGQRSLIRSLFNVFSEAVFSERDWHIFPPYYREDLEAGAAYEEKLRVVSDVISSMSEAQLVEIHQRLTGQGLGFALDQVMP